MTAAATAARIKCRLERPLKAVPGAIKGFSATAYIRFSYKLITDELSPEGSFSVQDVEFKQFRTQLFALYDERAYAEALDLIDRRAHEFEAYESDLLFWRACFAGCMGHGEGAIGWLRQAADRGHWYHERMLRDPDLDIIRESEELAQLQVVFHERYQRAQEEATPRRQVWEPVDTPQGLLVALHGAGGSILTEGDYWRPAADFGWRVAAVQSSQIWAPGRYHWLDTDKATEELRQHLAELGPAPSVVLAGFSMGAGLATRSALSGSLPSRGFLAVAPSFRMDQIAPLISLEYRIVV